jgi:GNAT superfamily N-acetyltransferase
MLICRPGTDADAPLLAQLNQQLIQDEVHRNRMTIPELERRMRNWLATEYRAALFIEASTVVAYALYRPEKDAVYVRQFFVCREHRRRGIGRKAMQMLLGGELAAFDRVYLDVLTKNGGAHCFWEAVGFHDYALTMEIVRDRANPRCSAP